MANYLEAYGKDTLFKEPADISANEGLKIALGMALWGYGSVDEATGVLTAPSGKTWDLTTVFPTVEDYYNETYAAYGGDPVEYASVESANGTDVLGNVNSDFIGFWGPQDASMGGKGVPNISGIVKVDDYTVEVTTNGYSAPAVYSILGIQVTPLHYYGDVAKYDYANNKFGFDFGDLSKQEELDRHPDGRRSPTSSSGTTTGSSTSRRIQTFTEVARRSHEIQFKETLESEVASAVQTGTADAGRDEWFPCKVRRSCVL